MASMVQPLRVQREGVAQVAGRILTAWRKGESADLRQELEYARCLAARVQLAGTLEMASTLEMERLEVLSGVVETLGNVRGKHAGAIRLLEHLATPAAPRENNFSVINLYRLPLGMPASGRC
jgi:hypothetical protein